MSEVPLWTDDEMIVLRERLQIAEDALRRIAACGCEKCGPTLSLAESRLVADDALTGMSVVEPRPSGR